MDEDSQGTSHWDFIGLCCAYQGPERRILVRTEKRRMLEATEPHKVWVARRESQNGRRDQVFCRVIVVRAGTAPLGVPSCRGGTWLAVGA